MFEIARNFAHFFAHESCGFCRPCRVGTNLLRDALDKIAEGRGPRYEINEKAVARACAGSRREAAKDAGCVARHRGAENFAVTVVKTERSALGVGQDQRRLEPGGRDGDAEAGFRAHAAGRAMER